MLDGKSDSSTAIDAEPYKNQIQAPSMNFRMGGGTLPSMREKFAANPVNGTGSMSYLYSSRYQWIDLDE